MSKQWFLYSNQLVSGPFSTEDVQEKLTSGQLEPTCFIWWKGQREWTPISVWERTLTQILASASGKQQRPIWYIDVGTAPIGPLTQNELIENLSSINELVNVKLWAVGMQKWKGLFEMHDVMELLGISRREHDRAPLMGTVAITRSNEDPRGFVVQAATISVAGMGLAEAQDLRRGDEISILLKSSEIPGTLHLRGEVVYITKSGHAGVRFIKVQPETHALIHDYVKRFTIDESSGRSAA